MPMETVVTSLIQSAATTADAAHQASQSVVLTGLLVPLIGMPVSKKTQLIRCRVQHNREEHQ